MSTVGRTIGWRLTGLPDPARMIAPVAPAISARAFWIVFAIVTVACVALRFHGLASAPIWMDESATLGFAGLPVQVILFNGIDNHPPLSFVLQHFWQLISPDQATARVPSAVAGVAAVVAIIMMMRDLVSSRAALISGALLALSTGHIFFSQDARMYPLLVLGLVMAAWGALGSRQEPSIRYTALYITGGAVAIYSQLLGLVGMAVIALPALALGITQRGRGLVAWWRDNLILLVIVLPWLSQVPESLGAFPGLAETSLTDAQWKFRNATGFPGLFGWSLPFELLLYGSVCLGVVSCWFNRQRQLALVMGGLAVAYPALILMINFVSPLVANRVFTPAIIGVCMAAGYALSVIKPARLGLVLTAVLLAGATTSALLERSYRVKVDNYPAAFEIARAAGFGDAPVLTCNQLSTDAVWRANPGANIYYDIGGDALRFQGPQYWTAAGMSMARLRQASAAEIDTYLGGGWLVDGGIEGLLAREEVIVFMRNHCRPEDPTAEQRLYDSLASAGFVEVLDRRVTAGASKAPIMVSPRSRVTVFERKS